MVVDGLLLCVVWSLLFVVCVVVLCVGLLWFCCGLLLCVVLLALFVCCCHLFGSVVYCLLSIVLLSFVMWSGCFGLLLYGVVCRASLLGFGVVVCAVCL